jgi:hypothetical protein
MLTLNRFLQVWYSLWPNYSPTAQFSQELLILSPYNILFWLTFCTPEYRYNTISWKFENASAHPPIYLVSYHRCLFFEMKTLLNSWCLNYCWDDKVRAHKGDMRVGKTPKKLDSICCPQCRQTKADTLKWQRPIGEGDQELEKRLVREELI